MSAWRCHRPIAATAINGLKWMWHLLKPLHGVCQQWVGLLTPVCLGIASNIESTSLLCWPSGAGARHRRRMSSQVCSLYIAGARWTFIPFELPIHPTGMAHVCRYYCLLTTHVTVCVIWHAEIKSYLLTYLLQLRFGAVFGAERPSTRGGTSQKLGRNDRVWGGRGADKPGADRLWGGPTAFINYTNGQR